MMIPRFKLGFLLLLLSILFFTAESKCRASCDFALASYYVVEGSNLTFVNEMLQSPIMRLNDFDPILRYNNLPSKDIVKSGTRVLVPFTCGCLPGSDSPGHVFDYSVRRQDTYERVAESNYANLTTAKSLLNSNSYPETNIPDTGRLNVTVNCFCGDGLVSKKYGLFITYPLRTEDSLGSIVSGTGLPADLLQKYNPGVDFSSGSGIVFIPGKDLSGEYPPFKTSKGVGPGVIAGICVGVAVCVLLTAFIIYGVCRKKKSKEALLSTSHDLSAENGYAPSRGNPNAFELVGPVSSSAIGPTGITVDKSVEFSYEELAKATDNFNMACKIGEGGFGAVYYAELRGEKAAIKKMEMQASKQFLAELKVLTRVHHVNLVRLIGYCVEGSLCVVYEYIENGNLGQHLRGTGRDPLPWSTRVQISLDSARGLEYIHEHTVPVYIHRDIKSANILIDQNYRAKVADFGLTKLTEVGGATTGSHAMGTFGYMPPESVYGDISAKVDVYAFGVVLYELISAKDAIVKLNDSGTQFKGLVALFDEVFRQPDSKEALRKIIDPRLGNNYPFVSVYKMVELARACTQGNPQLRPSMRYVVVALMTLSSSTGNWDMGNLENEDLTNLMSGR